GYDSHYSLIIATWEPLAPFVRAGASLTPIHPEHGMRLLPLLGLVGVSLPCSPRVRGPRRHSLDLPGALQRPHRPGPRCVREWPRQRRQLRPEPHGPALTRAAVVRPNRILASFSYLMRVLS